MKTTTVYRWVLASDRKPKDRKEYLIRFNKIEQELGNRSYIEDLIENGWPDVAWLEPIEAVVIWKGAMSKIEMNLKSILEYSDASAENAGFSLPAIGSLTEEIQSLLK